METPVGPVPRARTELRFADRLGTVKARLAIGRMRYSVRPGLYAVGEPDADSPAFVTANYKMSFDSLRGVLAGRDGWILVLDTRGINVWCAAGKGTFGTDELVARIEQSGLADVVAHRTLVLPQLGAPGVSAHEVRKRTGFRVVWGPIRTADLPAFLEAGMEATPAMRRVSFTLRERLVLIPVELVTGAKYMVPAALAMAALGGLGRRGEPIPRAAAAGLEWALLLLLAFAGGAVVTPALLPHLPGRAFALKGAWVGTVLGLFCGGWRLYVGGPGALWPGAAGWLLVMTAVSSFFGMNFTGASPYTSLSGVRREMRFALPAQAGAAILGLALLLIGQFA